MTVSIDANIKDMNSSVMEGASALSDKENYMLNTTTDAIHSGGNNQNIEDYYELLPDVLGQGRFGIVRECIELETGKKFAVKTLRKRPSNQAVLQAEVQLIKLAQGHENILKFVNVFQNDFYMHIITEICHGGRLSDYIVHKFQETTTNSQGTLDGTLFPEGEAACLIDSMLDAVVHLHERNIVHRDLKLENFLFRSSPASSKTNDSNSCCDEYDNANLTLIDFGLATTYRSDVDEPPTSVVGNPLTIAPEVVLNKEDDNCNGYTQACDIWSCGVIAFILLEGRPPFPDNVCTSEEIVDYFKRGKDDLNSDEDYYTDDTKMSLEAKEFLQCLLQRDPRRRWTAQKARKHPWIQKHVSANTTTK